MPARPYPGSVRSDAALRAGGYPAPGWVRLARGRSVLGAARGTWTYAATVYVIEFMSACTKRTLPVQTGGHCVGIRQTLQPIRRNNAQRMVHSTAGTGRMSASRPRATALMRAGSIGFTRKVDTLKRSSNRRMTASSCELTTTIGIPGK